MIRVQQARAAVISAAAFVVFAFFVIADAAQAQVTAFKQAVAESASSDRDIADFYLANNFEALWTGPGDEMRQRRAALFEAIEDARAHGLPVDRYDARGLMATLASVKSARDRGFAEVEMSRTFLRLARDMQTGALSPSKIDSGIKREVPYRDRTVFLTEFAVSPPRIFFRNLPPDTNEYARLMKEKLRLEHVMRIGGWGSEVSASSLKPGQSGTAVVSLRERLTAMGYLQRSATNTYDANIEAAVQRFQQAHGLEEDGVAGAGTVTEINAGVETRLKSVVVAMERERWLNRERGSRHVLVNLTDFSARIIDNDRISFMTRAVVGKNESDRRSPEFSDEMEHMIINPTWHVPRSIAVNEYLPMLKRNPGAVGHLKLVNSRGQVVSRGSVNFRAYNARNFPFALKQPPSSRNALGLVKFMFPNRYNIYLHDTPSKSLFQREIRAFSHGCIRLQQPFEFAYEILAKQVEDPKGFFHSKLRTGSEIKVVLDTKIPVHIIYRTAFTDTRGRAQFRRDVYGRDAKIWRALSKAGVSLGAVRS